MNTPPIDLARELAEAGERLSESIHDIELTSQRMRERMSVNQLAYFRRRDAERMFR